METVDLREAKWRYRWGKVKEKASDGLKWVVENKDVAVPLIIAGSTAAQGVVKITCKLLQNRAVNKEIDYKERTIYDRSLGRYVELKKPLTNAQALTIEERRADGEKLISILDDMRLLKK